MHGRGRYEDDPGEARQRGRGSRLLLAGAALALAMLGLAPSITLAGLTPPVLISPPMVVTPGQPTVTSFVAPSLLVLAAPRLAGTGTFALSLTCPAAAVARCRGVARIITLPVQGNRSALRSGAELGSTIFVIAPGQTRTVPINVPKRLRAVLRSARRVRLVGVAISFGSGGRRAAATGPPAMLSAADFR